MCYLLDVLTVIFVIFYCISPSTTQLSEDDVEKRQLKLTFDKLLYELINMNQQRLNAINRVLQLEDRPLTLRSSGEAGEALDNNPLIVYLVKQKENKNDNIDKYNSERQISNAIMSCLRLKGLRDLGDTHEDSLDIDTRDVDVNVLNANIAAERTGVLRGWKDCRKSASSACKKACISATKTVCRDYRCSSRMKKAFHKECKSNCKDRFMN